MIECKLVDVAGDTGIVLPAELLEDLRLRQGDSLLLLRMPDGTWRVTPPDEAQATRVELAEGFMHEEDA